MQDKNIFLILVFFISRIFIFVRNAYFFLSLLNYREKAIDKFDTDRFYQPTNALGISCRKANVIIAT